MAQGAPHRCIAPGCRVLLPRGTTRCEAHAVKRATEIYERRGTTNASTYGADWRRLRARFLAAHPYCACCGVEAKHVDHVVSAREAPHRRLDATNLQALCASCHSKKTALEDGGFGRAPR